MKKTIQPAREEITETWCDGTGAPLPEGLAPLTLTLDFGFGSRFDGAKITLHYSEAEAEKLVALIKTRLCEKSCKTLEEKITNRNPETITARKESPKSKIDLELERALEKGGFGNWGRNPGQELDGSEEIESDGQETEETIDNLLLYEALLKQAPRKERRRQNSKPSR